MAVDLQLLREIAILKNRIRASLEGSEIYIADELCDAITPEELAEKLEELTAMVSDPVDLEFLIEIKNVFRRLVVVPRGSRFIGRSSLVYDDGLIFEADE